MLDEWELLNKSLGTDLDLPDKNVDYFSSGVGFHNYITKNKSGTK